MDKVKNNDFIKYLKNLLALIIRSDWNDVFGDTAHEGMLLSK